MKKLRVSENGHFFQTEDGDPFFFLGDTAWVLFNKLKKEEIRLLFENRARKGFNVILSVVFRDLFEPNSPNAYGIRPFASEADMKAVKLNPEWMEWVRQGVALAGETGLYMGLLPTWGDKWNEHSNSAGPVIMDRDTARSYGRQLSDSLADLPNVIWILGGDSPIQTQRHADIVHAMAAGIKEGGSADRLMTFYPCHDACSDIFHASQWLDFNSLQSGHQRPNIADYKHIETLYRLQPAKPCMNLEANFEECPMFMMMGAENRPPKEPLFSAYDVRKSLYRSVLAGGAGFSYGCEPIRQLYREGERVHVHAGHNMPEWTEVLDVPGSSQMQRLPNFLKERSYFTRVPAQELWKPYTYCPGIAMDFSVPDNRDPASHVQVAKCSEGRYIMAYCPVRQAVVLDTGGLKGERFTVSLYNPESGCKELEYTCCNNGTFTGMPLRDLDTFIVLDALG